MVGYFAVVYDLMNKYVRHQSQICETEHDACNDIVNNSSTFKELRINKRITRKLLQRFCENHLDNSHCTLYKFYEIPIVDSPKKFVSI